MSKQNGSPDITPPSIPLTPGAPFTISGFFWRRDPDGVIREDNAGPIEGFISAHQHHIRVPERNPFPARAFAKGIDGAWTLEVSGESLRPGLIKALSEHNKLFFIVLQAGVGRTVIPLTVKS